MIPTKGFLCGLAGAMEEQGRLGKECPFLILRKDALRPVAGALKAKS
ncbi:MAG: hypothetical protein WC364_02575 [Eubacteriales bacterium]|jgi:hypothetical protein